MFYVDTLAYSGYDRRMKRRKPKDEQKETSVRIRLTAEQKDTFTQAAKKAGLDLSGWVRSTCLREVANADG